jgi:lysozyme
MNRRPQLVEALKLHEGLRLSPYHDTKGFLTIGYGHNLDAKPLAWLRPATAITKRIAEAILDMDVDDAIRGLDTGLPWWRELDDVREQVLADMAFNMGMGAPGGGGLRSFVTTLGHVRAGRWAQAKAGMLASKWHRDVGARAEELAEMMLTGKVVVPA